MARVPRIQSPCPLRWAQAPSGPCTLCGKSVLNLDRMSDAQRARALGECGGSVCVSYRVPRAMALAAGLITASALMAPPADAAPTLTPPTETALQSPAPAQPLPLPTTEKSEEDCEDLEMILVGGIQDARETEWAEVPETTERRDLPAGDEDSFLAPSER